jgi:hypothetical protein
MLSLLHDVSSSHQWFPWWPSLGWHAHIRPVQMIPIELGHSLVEQKRIMNIVRGKVISDANHHADTHWIVSIGLFTPYPTISNILLHLQANI